MYVERLDLDDFGCFERARIEGLSDGLTVIAGPQRAGKTTFMEAVRRLGYGIRRGDELPPPSDAYDLTATVVADDQRYQIEIEGYADPRVVPLDGGPERDVGELYGGLGEGHYQQLYTISLDELRRIPHSLDDDASLSAILLGAAYGDVLDVPTVRSEFASTATEIGGKNASARGVYRMKEPMSRIRDGIDARSEAIEQVDEHERKSEKRDDVDDRIAAIDDELAESKTERIRLEAVVSNHEEYRRLRDREEQLEEIDGDELESFPLAIVDDVRALHEEHERARRELAEARDEFDALVEATRSAAGSADEKQVDEVRANEKSTEEKRADEERADEIEANGGAVSRTTRDRLLAVGSKIRRYAAERSGWRERVEAREETARELERRRRELRRAAGELHPEWDGDLERVSAIDADPISSERLRSTVEAYRDAESDVQAGEETVSELSERLEDLDERVESAIDAADGADLADQYPVAAAGAIASVVAGIAAGLLGGPIAGALVTTFVLLGTGAYIGSNLDPGTPTHEGVSVDALRAERDKVETERSAKRSTLLERRETLRKAQSELNDVAALLGLPADVPVGGIRQFHDDLVTLQSEIAALEGAERTASDREDDLRSELAAAAETLEYVGALESRSEEPLADTAPLFAAIDRSMDRLRAAEAVVEAERARQRVERELIERLEAWSDDPGLAVGESSRIDDATVSFLERGDEMREFRKAAEERDEIRRRLRSQLSVSSVEPSFERYRSPADDEEWHVDAFGDALEAYGDVAAVEDRLDEIDDERTALEDEREGLVERRLALDRELEALASDEDVQEAHATIEAGRKQLEPLAEQYASARIAERLLERLHERFVARTTGPLLEDASDILERITDDAYATVDSENEFDDVDFVARSQDGTTRRTGELSRATAEQLFLAVRLARIRHHDVALPILLDDSLTNFDPGHVDRTLETIAELTADTQVFLLTCHPALLERIESRVDAAYWNLEDGRFDGPYSSADRSRALLTGE